MQGKQSNRLFQYSWGLQMSLLITNATLSGSQPRRIAHKAHIKDFKVPGLCQPESNVQAPLLF